MAVDTYTCAAGVRGMIDGVLTGGVEIRVREPVFCSFDVSLQFAFDSSGDGENGLDGSFLQSRHVHMLFGDEQYVFPASYGADAFDFSWRLLWLLHIAGRSRFTKA